MEGSRPPHGTGAARSGRHAKGDTLLERIYFDHKRMDHQRIDIRGEQELDGDLSSVIAGEIVPRLMLLHTSERARASAAATPKRQAADMSVQVADFTEMVLRHECDVLEAYVKSLLQRGLDLETVLLHLLAPAARRLGMLWEEDHIDFVEVTVGTSRLQQLLHRLTFELKKKDSDQRSVLFVSATHEQHTFGLVMVSEFFRREGWQVRGGVSMETEELKSIVAEQHFAVIGFSLSCDRLIKSLCSTIQSVRRWSRNKSVLIMVGGRVFAQDPALRPWVGADIVAADAREAIEFAEQAVRASALRRGPHL